MNESIERATTEPPRWPWVIVGLAFFPAAAVALRLMARVARKLSFTYDFLRDHPALAGLVMWVLIGLLIAGVQILRHRAAQRAGRPTSDVVGDSDAAPAPEAQQPAPPPAGLRSMRGAIVEGLIYGLVIFIVLLPASSDPLNRIAGTGDAWNSVWLHWRLADMLKSGNLLPWHIPDAVFPFGLDLRVSDAHIPTLIGTLWAMVAPPVVAFNLAVATAFLLNILAARRLARLFIKDRIPVMILALAYATAPALALRSFGHFTLLVAFAAPLLIAEGVEISRGDREAKPLRLAGLLLIAYLSGVYWLVTAGIGLALIVVLSAGPLRAKWRQVGVLALAAAITAVVISPVVFLRLRQDNAEAAAGANPVLTSEAFYYSADAYSVFAQPVSSTFDAPWNGPLRDQFIPNTLEATIFPGFLLLIGFGALLFTRSRLRIPLAGSAVALWLLTLGPGFTVDGESPFGAVGWLPFQLLLSIPGFGSLRAPNRASFVLAAVLTAALAYMVSLWWPRWDNSKRSVAAVIGFLLLAVNLQLPINNAQQPTEGDEVAVLQAVAARAEPGDTVMIVPSDCFGRVGITSNWQQDHGLPFVGCQGNTASLPLFSQMDSYMTQAMSAFRCQPEAFARRIGLPHDPRLPVLPDHMSEVSDEFGVRFLLIDKTMVEGDATCAERGKASSIESLVSWYEKVGETEQLLVLDVSGGRLSGDEGLEASATALFEIMLGRSPSQVELTNAATAIEVEGRDSLRQSIRASEEFASVNCRLRPEGHVGAADINDPAFVSLVYDTMLLRRPDPEGFTNALGYLAAATGTRDGLVRSIVASSEFQLGACSTA